jgi:dienelactone hydrolase
LASHWLGDKAALNRGETRLQVTDHKVQYYYGLCLDYLLARADVNRHQVAAMGVCQSGGYPLLINSIRPEISANIVVYGGTGTSEEV